jgi:hypothetical protein
VRFDGRTTTTNPDGVFVFSQTGKVPIGQNRVQVLGSSAPGFTTYPDFEYLVDVQVGDIDAVLPNDLTLPDLNESGSDIDTEELDLDGNLAFTLSLDTSPFASRIDGPAGTTVSGSLAPGASTVNLFAVYLDAEDFVYALPSGQIIPSGLLFGPIGLEFSTPTQTGLDLDLENDLGLAEDDTVDIWAVNPTTGAWFNRSTQSGIQGTVVDDGGMLVIRAPGIVDRASLYAAALPADPDCSTQLVGRLVDGTGAELAGLTVRTEFGATTKTNADGEFSFDSVPAYDPLAPTCTTVDFDWTIAPSPTFGPGAKQTATVMAADVVAGGTTDLGDVVFTLPTTGCIAGVVNGMPLFSEIDVELTGTQAASIQPDASGNFFECELPAGSYTASYTFPNAQEAVTAELEVVPGKITTVALQNVTGQGTGTFTVYVKRYTEGLGSTVEIVEGAQVYITGTDDASSTGLTAITDAAGRATFSSVSGPFDVTAYYDTFTDFGYVRRELMTGIQLDPANGRADLLLGLSDASLDQIGFGGSGGATVTGTVSSIATDTEVQVNAVARKPYAFYPTNGFSVADSEGLYTVPATPNRVLDVWFSDYDFVQAGPGQQIESFPRGLGLSAGVAPLGFEGQAQIDFDLAGSGYAPFDEAITVDDSGVTAAYGMSQAPQVWLELANVGQNSSFDVSVGGGSPGSTFPTSVLLPAADASAFPGYDHVLRFALEEASGPFGPSGSTVEYQVKLGQTNPTSVTIDFITAPTFAKGEQFKYSPSLNGHTFNMELDAFLTETDTNGFELLEMLGYAVAYPPQQGGGAEQALGGGGGRELIWTILLPAGTESYEFPSYADGMLGLTTSNLEALGYAYMSGTAVTTRPDAGVTADYAAAFGVSAQQQLESALQDFSSLRIGTNGFEIGIGDD